MSDRHSASQDLSEYDDPRKLSEYQFSDVYIRERDGQSMIKLLNDTRPLVHVALNSILDLATIWKLVTETGQEKSEFRFIHDRVNYRVSRIPDETDPYYVLRRGLNPIPKIGLLMRNKYVMQALGEIGKKPNRGLILFSGATGQGKTTTASSLLQQYLRSYGDIAVAIEDPPELHLHGSYNEIGFCYQTPVQNGNFASALRAALRFNPRYIYMGEIRDPPSATEALRAAISGHIVISTIHAGSIEEALTSMIKYVQAELEQSLAQQMLADGLSVVFNQELKKISKQVVHEGEEYTDVQIVPIIRYLFAGNHKGLRAKIREGKVSQIGDDISRQLSLVQKQLSPLLEDKRGEDR